MMCIDDIRDRFNLTMSSPISGVMLMLLLLILRVSGLGAPSDLQKSSFSSVGAEQHISEQNGYENGEYVCRDSWQIMNNHDTICKRKILHDYPLM